MSIHISNMNNIETTSQLKIKNKINRARQDSNLESSAP